MIKFPDCKINIGLNILSKREDGYHNLQTIFYPIPLNDVLDIVEFPGQPSTIRFTSSGLPIDATSDNNLCVRAARILQRDFPHIPGLTIHLHKNIPMGAGLGGGSADAAFVLLMINEKFQLRLSEAQLIAYALQLGSDCPFFIRNQSCFATGRGEIMEPLAIDLSGYELLLINPGIHVNTGGAFAGLHLSAHSPDLKAAVAAPIHTWKNNIRNDFEQTVFQQYPEIAAVKASLYANGAVYASMSGSGSTVYGIFEKGDQPAVNFPSHYFCQWV